MGKTKHWGEVLTEGAERRKAVADADQKVRDGLEAKRLERVHAAEKLYRDRVHEMATATGNYRHPS